MRKILISLAAAGSVLAIASPAAAQYYPGQYGQPYGYGAPYGNAYGYNNYGYGQVRSLQVRLNMVERQINRLDRRNQIGNRESNRLRREADRVENRLRNVARNGLNPYEANDINRRIAMLEQRVQFAANNGWNRYGQRYGWNGNYGYNGYNGYNGYGNYADRDRDGRDDRYEDDQGRDHDD